MIKWLITPNGIENCETHEKVDFRDERAFPFFATHSYGIICGQPGDSHSVALGDKQNLVTMKVMRNLRDIPNYAEDAFPDLDLSRATSIYEKARLCYNKIQEDIFCEGRCYVLDGENVFMFWQNISDEEKEGIMHAICAEKGLDDSACKAAKTKQDGSSPDTVFIGYKAFSYKDKRAKTFIVFKDGNVKIINGSNHAIFFAIKSREIAKEKEKQGIRTSIAAEEAKLKDSVECDGRFWDLRDEPMVGKVVFALWSSNMDICVNAIKQVCDMEGINFNEAYLAKRDKLINISEYETFIPSDSDYADNPFNDTGEQERLNQLRQIHTAEQGESIEAFRKNKLDATAPFRAARDQKWADEHRNDDGSVPEKAKFDHVIKPFMEENVQELTHKDLSLDDVFDYKTYSPDSLVFNGHKLSYSNGLSFIALDQDGKISVVYAKRPGEKHFMVDMTFADIVKNRYIMSNLSNEERSRLTFMKYGDKAKDDDEQKWFNYVNQYGYNYLSEHKLYDGRAWPLGDNVILAFWNRNKQTTSHFGPMAKVEIAKKVCDKLGKDFNESYILSSKGDNEFIKSCEASALELSDNLDKESELERMKQQHINGEVVGGKEFISSRDEEWANNHRNDDGSVPIRASWNAQTRLDESFSENPYILYHGTPHKFDKFSMDKVNTGQHSQDFGMGLYFTTDKQTAEFYADELSHKMSCWDKYKKYVGDVEPDEILKDYLDKDYTVSIKRVVKGMLGKTQDEGLENFLNSLDKVERYAYVYTVKISNPNYITREDYLKAQKAAGLSDLEMNEKLKEYGYNGIIYDMNTRGCSDRDFTGEKNVVIFDDSCIHIVNVERMDFDGAMKLDYVANQNNPKRNLFMNESQLKYLKELLKK